MTTRHARHASSDPSDHQMEAAAVGAAIGREAAAQMNALINDARDRCAGDPAAICAMATVLLHKIVDNGRGGEAASGDSAAAALRADRGRAAVELNISPAALSLLLPGVGPTRASDILVAGRDPERHRAAARRAATRRAARAHHLIALQTGR